MTTVIKEFDNFSLTIEFDYSPGSPGTMYAPNGDPGDPPEPDELDVNAVWLEVDNDHTNLKTPGATKIDILACGLIEEMGLGDRIETIIFDMMPEPEPDYSDEPEPRDIDEETWGRL